MANKQIVSKDNDLIGATYSLGVAEQRLIFLAIIEAREQNKLIDVGKSLRIYAKSYEQQFNVEKHTAYEAMKRAVDGLYEAGFSYDKIDEASGKNIHYKSRWVEKIAYADELGCVELTFASDVIPLITRLENCYTEYELRQVSSLQSEYAIRLYELIIRWRSVGKTNKIMIDDLRAMLGVDPEKYKQMNNFKAKVLDHAITQINKYTDISAEYEQHKQGRVITAFTFKFKAKNKKQGGAVQDKAGQGKKNEPSNIVGLNDKQLGRIVRNAQFIADYNHLVSPTSPAGQNSPAWEAEMINRLKKDITPFNKRPIRDYLEA